MVLVNKCISEFRMGMLDMGYADPEIDAFIKDILEDRKISSLSREESEDIMDNLNDYLSFAKKCKRVIQN